MKADGKQMRKSINLFFLIFTMVGLLASIIVHFSLYFDFSLYEASSNLWLTMQLAIFGGWIGGILLRNSSGTFPGDLGRGRAPKLLIVLGALFVFSFSYAWINFHYCDDKLKSGYPYIVEGQRFLYVPRGNHYLTLTVEQFHEAELYQARKTSGHWMICHLIPCMVFYERYKWHRLA
jgi:hypothetical protein